MKFSDLSSAARSMLAALRSTNYLTTDRLGAGCTPKLLPVSAAAVLLELRKKGLVFSHQKTQGETYCKWAISDLGIRVFDGRPHDVEPVAQAPEQAEPARKEPSATVYMVVRADGKPDAGWVTSTDADTLVRGVQQYLTSHPGHAELTVIEQTVRRVAVITAPAKPEAQIHLL